ncbi:hypothetical protein OIU84_020273 [Salix udensis]|uniref:DUF4283 domain-containing protein n=1 Tax=Salix udensis TaxID=889485 RepID=A0AAD6NP65_9ROSI|nr:hypothetical protein OIU84_020273 [Salix udensis]
MNNNKPTHHQQAPNNSWAEKVRVSNASTRCTLERLARQPPGSILKIPHDMQMAEVETWTRSIIGFFVGYKMPFHAVQAIANMIWKANGLEKTMVMSNGFMIFRFSSETKIDEVLAKGPWMFGGKAIILQRWHPGFQFDKNKIKTIPVWARLQGLPFPLWNKQGLSLAASMVGRPVACDDATIQCSRLEFARVCIEIEASLPLVHNFQVESTLSETPITVDVAYEWKPARCESCKVFGHSCKTQNSRDVNKGKEKLGVEEDTIVVDQDMALVPHTGILGKSMGNLAPSKGTQEDINKKKGVQIFIPSQANIDGTPTANEGQTALAQEIATTLLPNIFSADHTLYPEQTTKLAEGLPKTKAHTAVMQNLSITQTSNNDTATNTHKKNPDTTKKDNLKGKRVEANDSIEEGTNMEGNNITLRETPMYHCVESKMDTLSTSTSDMAERSNNGEHSARKVSLVTLSPSARKRERKKKRKEAHSLRQISSNNLDAVLPKVLPANWQAISNVHDNPLCRIVVGWNFDKFEVNMVHSSSQWITCDVLSLSSQDKIRLTFIYGSNSYKIRSSLWQYIKDVSIDNVNIPWALLGDFNAILRPSDRCGGSNAWLNHHNDFPNCIMQSSLQHLPYSGIHLSWHNGQSGDSTVMKKLDWVFGNLALSIKWPQSRVSFLPRQASDHSAMILNLEANQSRMKPSFKLLNQWAKHEDFLDIVRCVWNQRIVGNPLFQFTTKLSMLKIQFGRKHQHSTSHIAYRVFKAKGAWEEAQRLLDKRLGILLENCKMLMGELILTGTPSGIWQ